jgi:hypothetical protein
MRQPGLFGVVGAEATCKEGCRDNRDGSYAGQPATTAPSQGFPTGCETMLAAFAVPRHDLSVPRSLEANQHVHKCLAMNAAAEANAVGPAAGFFDH